MLIYFIGYITGDISSMVSSNWLNKLNRAIPLGFSRYYILSLLTEQELTGQEIIEKLAIQNSGKLKPSPGLVYPLLGRLFKDGFIEETNNGKYKITKRGLEITADLQSIKTIIKKPFYILAKVKHIGAFMIRKFLERLSHIKLLFSKKKHLFRLWFCIDLLRDNN